MRGHSWRAPLRRMTSLIGAAMVVAATGNAAAAPEALSDENLEFYSVQVENDLFGGGTDHHYTHGTRFSYLSSPVRQPWIKNAAEKIPYFVRDRDNADIRITMSLGQSIFTPDNIAIPTIQANDRPYAGWLYFGAGIISRGVDRDTDPKGRPLGIKRLELDIGVVGPMALSHESQTFVHSILGIQKPRGWHHQLSNEPAFTLYGERAWGPYSLWSVDNIPVLGDFGIDVSPYLGGALGNVFTYASTGLTLRMGTDLVDTWSPPRIRPSLPGAEFYRPRGIKAYVFAAGEARAVGRNIFLDGNTFRSSQSVPREPYVLDFQAGVVLIVDHVQITFTNILRTKEFDGQPTPDNFGAISVSLAI